MYFDLSKFEVFKVQFEVRPTLVFNDTWQKVGITFTYRYLERGNSPSIQKIKVLTKYIREIHTCMTSRLTA